MSTPDQEARALDAARDLLLAIGSGRYAITGHISELRADARRVLKHYPLLPADWAARKES